LVSISIVKNQKDESRGFGYVTFSSPDDVKAVISGVHKINGKMVSILLLDI
jgi:RNA recognition motif-containing protein